MADIRYIQPTHDARPGDVRTLDDRYAKILVLLGKAEYIPPDIRCDETVPDSSGNPPPETAECGRPSSEKRQKHARRR
nr:hypothetical protein [Escherichia coli]